MDDVIHVLVAVRGAKSEPTVVEAIEDLSRTGGAGFEVLESLIDDDEGENEMGPVIYFP